MSGTPLLIRRASTPLLLAVVVLIGAGFLVATTDEPAVSGPIVLPLEVLGPDGYTVSTTFDVADPSGAARLWMQVHNLSYAGKGSVRLNDGPWVRLDNSTVTCAYPESEYGCLGGGYKTIRATVPISGVRAGANTIEFRHNYAVGSRSSGYRVLRFNLLDSGGGEILSASAYRYDDPDSWTPPRNNASDIDEGKRLWQEEGHLADVPGGPSIQASCANCHARGGEDLKYFNYSNRSIIARSEFHGLSQREAEQIASYIRSLDHPNPGTPWDPPYQPGPGLDDRPAEEWAAGAGLGAVLDRDEDMLPYLFPNGISADAVSTTRTLNVREMPVAIQFPDWNEWLPRVHPKDAWGDAFANHEVYRDYEDRFPIVLSQGVDEAVQSGDIVDLMEDWANEFRQFKKDTGKEDHFGGYDPEGRVADYMLGLFQWQAVKTWEIMTTNEGLEEAAPQIYPGVGEPRSWFGQARAVFDVAPHINGPDQSEPFPHGSEVANRYFSTAWYQVQMTLNAGNRNGLNIRPQDWKYHMEHIRGNGKYSGVREPLRFYQSYIKMMQMADNARGVGSPSGWHLRHVAPVWLLSDRPGSSKDVFQDMDPDLRRRITEALLGAFMDKMERHDLSEWPREHGLEGIEPASFQPEPYSGSGIMFDQTTYANQFYRMLPRFNEMGVDPYVLDRIGVWSEAAWPKGDWSSLYDSPSSQDDPAEDDPPGDDSPRDDSPGEDSPRDTRLSIHLSEPEDGPYVAPADVTITAVFGENTETFRKIKFFVDGVQVANLRDRQMPASHTVAGLEAGTHELWVVAVDPQRSTSTSETVQITVEAGRTTTEAIELDKGWNVVTLSVWPADDRLESVLSSIADDLKRVEDDAGRVYHPSRGIEEFDTWDPERTYRVKVGRATTLVVEGTPPSQQRSTPFSAAAVGSVSLELLPNYPNPFRSTTVIGYTLPDVGPVSLKVYNVLGQHVMTLVEGTQSPGTYQVTFDGAALPAGVYVYRLESGDAQEVRQMVLVE